MTDPYLQEVAHRWQELARVAGGIVPTAIPLDPRPSEILAARDDLEVLAKHVDALLASYGAYLNAHSPCSVDQTYFTDRLWGDLQGNATYCVQEVADAVRERIMEGV